MPPSLKVRLILDLHYFSEFCFPGCTSIPFFTNPHSCSSLFLFLTTEEKRIGKDLLFACLRGNKDEARRIIKLGFVAYNF